MSVCDGEVFVPGQRLIQEQDIDVIPTIIFIGRVINAVYLKGEQLSPTEALRMVQKYLSIEDARRERNNLPPLSTLEMLWIIAYYGTNDKKL